MTIAVVPTHQVDQVWGLIADGIESACQATGGDISAGDLWQQCRSGSAFLIVVHEGDDVLGASVWRFERWSSGPKLRCLALYGKNLIRWIGQLREVAIQIMNDCGAKSLVAEGLEKWEPLFRRLCPNAKRRWVLYEEEID